MIGGEERIVQQTFLISGADGFGAGCAAPGGFDIGRGQNLFGPSTAGVRDEQHRDAFAARPSGAPAAVQKPLSVDRQVSVDDQAEIR